MRKHFVLVLCLMSLVVLLSLLLFFKPSDMGPLGVLVFFITLYIFLFSICSFLVSLFRRIFGGKGRDRKIDVAYSVIISFGLVLFLLILRLYKFNILMVFGLLFFMILGCFLVKKRLNVVK